MDSPWDAMPINQQSAQDAYEAVLADVGASLVRDSIDARIIGDVRNGTASNGTNGFISCPADTTLPTLNSTPAPTDSDHDGMPDDWETANGLNPNDASDRNQTYGPGLHHARDVPEQPRHLLAQCALQSIPQSVRGVGSYDPGSARLSRSEVSSRIASTRSSRARRQRHGRAGRWREWLQRA